MILPPRNPRIRYNRRIAGFQNHNPYGVQTMTDVQFSSGRIENGHLVITPVRTLKQSDMLACPHTIMMPEHYRDDGSCRCNSPEHTTMAEWGYVWDGASWIAPDDDD